MSPINLILIALVAGSISTDKVGQDAYKSLKALIQRKFISHKQEELELNKFEEDPTAWEQPLRIAMVKIGVDKDESIIKAALIILRMPNHYEPVTQKYQLPPLPIVLSPFVAEEGESEGTFTYGFEEQVEQDKDLARQLEQRQSEPQKRWINVEILDHERNRPLELGNIYTIAFTVDITQQDTSASVDFDQSRLFRLTEKQVVLKVLILSSKNFKVYTPNPQILIVPLRGKSRIPANFAIEPQMSGVGEINVAFFKNNNFIQSMIVKIAVEDPPGKAIIGAETQGRRVDEALAIAVKPRDITLHIEKSEAGFSLTFMDSVAAKATLPVTIPRLNSLIAEMRKALQDIVYTKMQPGNVNIYLSEIEIPPEINQQSLRSLANAGFKLYQEIFYNESADQQTRLVGDKLGELFQMKTLKIQIVSQEFLLPWGLLYVANPFRQEQIDPKMFLGFKHIIEHIPLQQNILVLDNEINSYPTLKVGIHVNKDIDQQMNIPVVEEQLSYWQDIQRHNNVEAILHYSRDDILQEFTKNTEVRQLLYFFCHATSQQVDDQSGPDTSFIGLSDDTKLTLGELKQLAPINEPLPGFPLVFLNACASAELSPLFYSGFMPYFVAKGARGMIGTECDVPALFAKSWAERFFDQFLQEQKSLGDILLDLRREFLVEYNNVLGLLYTVYCDSDTRIVPGLELI